MIRSFKIGDTYKYVKYFLSIILILKIVKNRTKIVSMLSGFETDTRCDTVHPRLSYDTPLASFDEGDDCLNLLGELDLFFQPLYGLRDVQLRSKKDMVCFFQMTDCFLGKTAAFEADQVEPDHLERITASLDVRWDVFGHPITAPSDGVASDFDELVDGDDAPDIGVIVDLSVSPHVDSIGEDDMIPDAAIVGNMDIGHEKTIAADHCFHAFPGPPMKTAELSDDVPVAYLQRRWFAFVFEILRRIA